MRILKEGNARVQYEVRIYDEYDRYHTLYENKVSSLKAVIKFVQSKVVSLRKKASRKLKSVSISSLSDYTVSLTMLDDADNYHVYSIIEFPFSSFYRINDDTDEYELKDSNLLERDLEKNLNEDHEDRLRNGFYNENNGTHTINKPLYLERAAEDSLDDSNLWIRYLNKYINSDGNKITESIYNQLMNSTRLSREQKRILREAVIPGTSINLKVCSLSNKKKAYNEDKNIGSVNSQITDKAFELLNARLAENNLNLDITCAGGFVLQTLGIRATMDVDAFFRASSKIDSIINSVGEELGINDTEEDETWLNNSIANMNREPGSQYKELYKSYSNLNVYMVTPEYLIGMKLNSGREKDFKDVSLLIKKLDLESPVQLYKKLRKMKFKPDFADIIGCFGDAYGHKWLASYYKDHAVEIADYM